MMKLKMLIVVAGLLMAGCGTKPISISESKIVADEKIYDKTFITRHVESDVEVIVKRDAGLRASVGGGIPFYIDGEKIASFRPGTMLRLFLPPKTYMFGVKMPADKGINEIDADVKKDIKQTYRIYFESAFEGVRVQRSSQ